VNGMKASVWGLKMEGGPLAADGIASTDSLPGLKGCSPQTAVRREGGLQISTTL
jgi:hypothetical protein